MFAGLWAQAGHNDYYYERRHTNESGFVVPHHATHVVSIVAEQDLDAILIELNSSMCGPTAQNPDQKGAKNPMVITTNGVHLLEVQSQTGGIPPEFLLIAAVTFVILLCCYRCFKDCCLCKMPSVCDVCKCILNCATCDSCSLCRTCYRRSRHRDATPIPPSRQPTPRPSPTPEGEPDGILRSHDQDRAPLARPPSSASGSTDSPVRGTARPVPSVIRHPVTGETLVTITPVNPVIAQTDGADSVNTDSASTSTAAPAPQPVQQPVLVQHLPQVPPTSYVPYIDPRFAALPQPQAQWLPGPPQSHQYVQQSPQAHQTGADTTARHYYNHPPPPHGQPQPQPQRRVIEQDSRHYINDATRARVLNVAAATVTGQQPTPMSPFIMLPGEHNSINEVNLSLLSRHPNVPDEQYRVLYDYNYGRMTPNQRQQFDQWAVYVDLAASSELTNKLYHKLLRSVVRQTNSLVRQDGLPAIPDPWSPPPTPTPEEQSSLDSYIDVEISAATSTPAAVAPSSTTATPPQHQAQGDTPNLRGYPTDSTSPTPPSLTDSESEHSHPTPGDNDNADDLDDATFNAAIEAQADVDELANAAASLLDPEARIHRRRGKRKRQEP